MTWVRIFPGSVFLLAALAFGAGAVHFFHQFADYRLNGLPSVGTVLRVTVYPVNNGGKSSYTRYTDVRFATADGTLLEHSFHDELSGAKEGDQVDLLYKPGNPQDVISASWSTLLQTASVSSAVRRHVPRALSPCASNCWQCEMHAVTARVQSW